MYFMYYILELNVVYKSQIIINIIAIMYIIINYNRNNNFVVIVLIVSTFYIKL